MRQDCPSNSSPSAAELRPGEGGADTVSFVWSCPRGSLSELESSLDDLGEIGVRHGPADLSRNPKLETYSGKRGMLMLQAPILGHRVGFFFDSGTIWSEGRVSPIFSRWSNDPRLTPLSYLPSASEQVWTELRAALGLPFDFYPKPRLRRLDVASEVCFENRQAGQGFLQGLTGLTAGEKKTRLTLQHQQVQTVELFRGYTKLGDLCARFYDKGLERGGPSGERIRAEVQKRYKDAKKRPTVLEASRWNAQRFWKQELRHWLETDKELMSVPLDTASEQVLLLVENDELNWMEGERLLAALAISRHRGWGWWKQNGHEGSGRARRKRLQELGILVSPSKTEADLTPGLRALGSALREHKELSKFPPGGVDFYDATLEAEHFGSRL